MQSNEAFIRSNLGEPIQPISLVVNEHSWHGWQQLSLQGRFISVAEAQNINAKRPEVIALVNQLWLLFHQKNIRLWSHFGVDILAIPTMPVLDILKYEQVGSHSINSVTEIKQVHDSIKAIFNECAFEILFANSAGLEAVFLQPVDRTQAERFQEIIYGIAPASMNVMCHELYADQEIDDSDARLTMIATDHIQQKQRFVLYWD